MPSVLSLAVLFPGVVRLGNVRVSVFGFFAAAGLIAAVSLSQRTARLAGLKPERVWDAGVWAIVAAFVLSRVLLIAEDPAAFRRYPLIVLSLPSLTYEGMGLTVIATLVYLRIKRMPLLDVLDAWTPPAALLGAVLALAHFVEGTNAGMPTSLPWGVVTPGDTVLGRVHPVQLYLLAAATVICGFSYRALWRGRPGAKVPISEGSADRGLKAAATPEVQARAYGASLRQKRNAEGAKEDAKFAEGRSGAVAARAMIEGGVAFFVLDMFAQPYDAHSALLLDPGQYVALGCAAVGAALRTWLLFAPVQTVREISEETVHAQ